MKAKANRFVAIRGIHLAALCICLAPGVYAAALTWDSDTGASGAQDGSGTWTTGAGGWWNGSTNVNWATTDTATFGGGADAGTKTITLGGTITTAAGNSTTGGIHFANSGYTLSNTADANVYAITVGTATTDGFLTVAANKSATIGANATVQSASGKTMNISGGGILYVQDGGTIRNPTAGNNIFNIIGGTTLNVGTSGTLLSTNNQLVIGTAAGGGGALVVDGGTVTNGTLGSTTSSGAQNIVLANSATGSTSGTLTINSGLVTNNGVGRASGGESGLRFGTTSAGGTPSGVVNLNGGTLTVARVYENALASIDSTFNFNGGTLKVTSGAGNAANYMTGLDRAFIKEGGAIIDTNGVATTIGQTLEHGGIAVTDGGLTKSGSNALRLTGANSYTGITAVNAGGLVASLNSALGTTDSHTTVASGAALGFSGGISYSNAEKIVGSGVGNTSAISGSFASVQRGFVQSVSGSNTFAGNIEINATGISRIGTQDGASLTLSGSITRATGVSGVTVLFRTGTAGDFVTLSNSSNEWDSDTVIFTGATSGAGGVRLGVDNALPVATSIVAGGNSTGSGTSLDLNGFSQTLSGITTSNGALHITNNSATSSTLTLDTTTDRSNLSVVGLTTIEDGAGQVSLIKSGSFTQTLFGTHNYTGATTVSAGTLLINGSLGATNVTVNAGAFGGTGTVGGTLDLAGGSLHVMDLLNALDVTGMVTIYPGFGVGNLAGIDWGSVTNGTYTLINGTLGSGVFDALSNNASALAHDLGGGRSAYFQQGGLDLVVIPEPATALIGSLGLLALLRRRR